LDSPTTSSPRPPSSIRYMATPTPGSPPIRDGGDRCREPQLPGRVPRS
jgi:hypothetical protein